MALGLYCTLLIRTNESIWEWAKCEFIDRTEYQCCSDENFWISLPKYAGSREHYKIKHFSFLGLIPSIAVFLAVLAAIVRIIRILVLKDKTWNAKNIRTFFVPLHSASKQIDREIESRQIAWYWDKPRYQGLGARGKVSRHVSLTRRLS